MSEQIGRYRILHQIGEGGMGVVHAAVDELLGRRVAVKTIRGGPGDSQARQRFLREAKATASVSHPNICPIYDMGEQSGQLYFAMELLEGESLAARLERGPLTPDEAASVVTELLGALDAIHARQMVHRDLKPSNVFLTRHGAKLLDFGLAALDRDEGAETLLTLPGTVLGTPRYMAPERLSGAAYDARADLFAAGALLYEMLCGRPAFPGESMAQVVRAVTLEEPRTLDGSPGLKALEGVARKAMAKTPSQRYASAAEMRTALRAVASDPSGGAVAAPAGARVSSSALTAATAVPPRATRLLVLPFRVLRPDPETDFLAFSIPDAVAASLASVESLVVRPSTTAAAGGDSHDVSRIARESDVDVVMAGTLLRGGDHIRVSTQLLRAPAGTLIASHASQAPLGDLFQLQDELAQRIVDALALPITSREYGLHQDVPASPEAYELYLRANQMAQAGRWEDAYAEYRQCVTLDPDFAPAWARMGRMARVMAKFGERDQSELLRTAQSAFRRALEINPDYSAAHHLNAYLEVEMGRARFAMIQLLDRLRARRSDPELYGGLVQACRYCGLLEASASAHQRAAALDPGVRTSVGYTFLMQRDWEHALAVDRDEVRFVSQSALMTLGRTEEARRLTQETLTRDLLPIIRAAFAGYMAAGEGDRDGFLRYLRGPELAVFRDPEAFLITARCAARLGMSDEAIRMLDLAVRGGHFCASFLRTDPWLDSLRGLDEFRRIHAAADVLHREARAHYLAAGGEQLLGAGTAGVD